MYCRKTKTSYCIQPRHRSPTHSFVHWSILRHVHKWWNTRQMVCPNIYNYWGWILSVRCLYVSAGGFLWINQQRVKIIRQAESKMCVPLRRHVCRRRNWFRTSPVNTVSQYHREWAFTQYALLFVHFIVFACDKKAKNDRPVLTFSTPMENLMENNAIMKSNPRPFEFVLFLGTHNIFSFFYF